MNPLPEPVADRIYAVLVEACGAPDDPVCRRQFLAAQVRGCREYRFGGKLGFGGKFWNEAGRWYVTMYPEDETPGNKAMRYKTDLRLAGLRAELLGEGRP